MSGGYFLSRRAADDVFELWNHLADKATLAIADRVESKIYQAFELLAITPSSGHRRFDLTDRPVLFFRVRPYSYLIIYRARTPIEIVGVLHGRRDITEVLQDRIFLP